VYLQHRFVSNSPPKQPAKHAHKSAMEAGSNREEQALSVVMTGTEVPRLMFGSVELNPAGADSETSRWSINPIGALNICLAPSVCFMLRGKAPRAIVTGGRQSGPQPLWLMQDREALALEMSEANIHALGMGENLDPAAVTSAIGTSTTLVPAAAAEVLEKNKQLATEAANLKPASNNPPMMLAGKGVAGKDIAKGQLGTGKVFQTAHTSHMLFSEEPLKGDKCQSALDITDDEAQGMHLRINIEQNTLGKPRDAPGLQPKDPV
jgi:hypothetical protein